MPSEQKKPKRRRVRSPHPGVKIIVKKRTRGPTHYARFVDPDTGKETQTNLRKLGITDADARKAWCVTKCDSLRRRKAALAAGAPLQTQTGMANAVRDYFKAREAEGIKPTTLKAYREGAHPFRDWCVSAGVTVVEDLTGPKLEAFRKHFISRKAMVPAGGKGAGRGKRKRGSRRRSPLQVNKCLRGIRTMLNQWRREGLLPRMDSDSIKDGLRSLKVERDAPRFLRAKQIQALLKAAQRHDAETFTLTRKENAGEGDPGCTNRYGEITLFILSALLTGCRFSELAGLEWAEVDLEAREINLPASRTKTGQGRLIALNVTPHLVSLLTAMKLRAGDSTCVFGNAAPLDRDTADRARARLIEKYSAPKFTWHDLRRTCGTFLACAPGIYSGAGAFLAAKRLGHSVVVSERHYAGAVTDIPKKAATIEAAMGIEKLVKAAGKTARRAARKSKARA